MLTNRNMEVLMNVIGAVESGGQVYGKRNYKAYAEPYQNTKNEHTITLGWAQNYGPEAHRLIAKIFHDAPEDARTIDGSEIEKMIGKDWVKTRWKPTASQKKDLIALIDSEAGHKAQDELFAELMEGFIADCESAYTDEPKAVMMYCEIRHLGGKKAADRIFGRCGSYSLDEIMASLVKDQRDKTSGTQVGDTIFWSRHLKCREFIDRYADEKTEEEKMQASEITICGHGSGKPSTKNMKTYCASRYGQKASNGKRKQLVEVRRFKGLTDKDRQAFHDTYKTILGRNIYSQDLREYVYKAYKDGKFYSDCSSSGCYTLKQIGKSCPDLNTAGIHKSTKWETVKVEITNGQIRNPEALQVGDALLFVGNDPERPLQIGHVEYVYEIPGGEPEPEDRTNLKKGMSGSDVKTMQEKLIAAGYSCGSAGADGEFGNATEKAVKAFQADADLAVDGIYGPKTKAALQKAQPKKWKAIGTATAAKKVNVRSGAGTTHQVIRVLDPGNRFEVNGEKAQANGWTWVHLRLADTGAEGWIAEHLINYDK